MALRIKKQYKQPDGSIIEVEGTFAEIRQYEIDLEKIEKKDEGKKREKKLLKDEIQRLVQEEIAKQPPQQVHHYHYEWDRWQRLFPQDPVVPWNPYVNPRITWTADGTGINSNKITLDSNPHVVGNLLVSNLNVGGVGPARPSTTVFKSN